MEIKIKLHANQNSHHVPAGIFVNELVPPWRSVRGSPVLASSVVQRTSKKGS
ncbi:hypothetical protein PAHAL_1G256300 [Panicum hallii]|uniref:Uncharacterized protein n=1 Tax=Panicum hallii TaxID=206008 RepID=A0A2T8KWA7_9POAL|nr:hypothetical protein PAHAL_1G256300 [Panicum hallii]